MITSCQVIPPCQPTKFLNWNLKEWWQCIVKLIITSSLKAHWSKHISRVRKKQSANWDDTVLQVWWVVCLRRFWTISCCRKSPRNLAVIKINIPAQKSIHGIIYFSATGITNIKQVCEGQMSCWDIPQEGKEVDHIMYSIISLYQMNYMYYWI
jgi:hypothetical protein